MNVYELFQGITPIKRVYFNNSLVWTLPRFLPPYMVNLSTHYADDQYLSKSGLVHGYMNKTNELGELSNIINGPISASTLLLNRLIFEKYYLEAEQNVADVLSIRQIAGDFVEKPIFNSDNNVLSLTGEIISHGANDTIYESNLLYAMAANGELLSHTHTFEILLDQYISALRAASQNGLHSADFDLLVTHQNSIADAYAKFGSHSSEFDILFDYLYAAGNSIGKTSYHELANEVTVDSSHSAENTKSDAADHESTFATKASYFNTISDAVSSPASHDNNIEAYCEQAIGSIDVSSDVNLNGDYNENIEYSTSSNASASSKIITLKPDVYTEDVSAISIRVTGVNETIDENLSSEPSTATLNTMMWLLPQQAGSDLYIPQIYDDSVTVGAVQNGSSLILLGELV